MRIAEPELTFEGDEAVVTVRVEDFEPDIPLQFRMSRDLAPSPEAMADACYPVGLLLAMATDRKLILTAPLSRRTESTMQTVQEIMAAWFPSRLAVADVDAEYRDDSRERQEPQAGMSTFTGGVDSFYTLHQNFDHIDSLLFVHGFDVPLHQTQMRRVVSENLEQASAAADKNLLEVATNMRQLLNPHLYWGPMSHGAAIASAAMLFSDQHTTLHIPASHTYADMYPWGTHPLLDPLWSTGSLAVRHDGGGATRVAKIRSIADDPIAQAHLRVCFQKKGDYNCETCVRTKISLELTGQLDRFDTFDKPLDVDDIVRVGVSKRSDLLFARENLRFAREVDREDIAAALTTSIRAYKATKRGPAAATAKSTARAKPLTGWSKAVERVRARIKR